MPLRRSRRITTTLGAALLLLCLPAAAEDETASDGAAAPHPLPVFRSVLDGNPRMITVPLHAEMWLAYNAAACRLEQAWSGGVRLDGAVYTTVHGPQPTSVGFRYSGQHGRGSEWPASSRRRYLGYRVNGRAVTLRWQLNVGGRRVVVEETPSFVRSRTARPGLRRTFRVVGPNAAGLALDWPVRGLVAVDSNGAAHLGASGSPPSGRAPAPEEKRIRLPLEAGRPVWVEAYFDAEQLKADAAAQEARAAALKKDAEAAVEAEPAPVVLEHPQDTPVGNGVSVRVYRTGVAMSRLRRLVPGQTPNVSHVIPVLDLRTERGDFGDVADTFLTHVDGFLEIEQPGEYGFRLVSDDGSRLHLDDEVVVDHDGLHGPTAVDGKATLTKGRHKLFVEHFENGGGEQLTLLWRPPGASEWTIVPNDALRAPKGEVRVTSPGNKKLMPLASPGTPGDGKPLEGVHPAFTLSQARPDAFQPRVGGMDWHPDGRLLICCWEPVGGVYALSNVASGDPAKIEVRRIAAGLAEPLGLRVVGGRIYVLQKQELSELIDRDGDGLVDEYRNVASGWGVTDNFHEFAFGLVHKDGAFYAALATAIDPGGASTQPQEPDRGKVVKIWPDGRYAFVAHGLRTPNGIGRGFEDEIFVTDNQGDWLPVSKLVHVSEGAFFGSRSVDPEGTKDLVEKPPVVWLPQGEIGNSPGEPGKLLEGPYRGQMLHSDVTHGGLKRVFVESIEGQFQGAVFRFTQGLEAGINRWTRGPDGALYVGGIGSAGNWGQTGKLKYGLQRLAYNGTSVFEMLTMQARPNRFRVTFTEPLAAVSGANPEDYLVQQWRYEPTKAYGGPKKDVETLEVSSVVVSRDRTQATLWIDGLKAGHVVYVRLLRTIRNAAGERPWTTEAWYTLNRKPVERRLDAQRPPPAAPPANGLTEAERTNGWELLFDGKDLSAWRGYRKEDVPPAWRAEGGTLHLAKGGDGGDLITRAQYEDFDLRLEWKVAPGGNSGVCYRLTEEHGAMWMTGPEMQVLDNEGHGDGLAPMSRAGACYALYAPPMDVSRPAGRWNQARIRLHRGRLEQWLNGWKLVDTELNGADWKERLAKSKFKDTPGFGTQPQGHIGLQDHGDEVWYRNLKIRRLP